MYKRQTVDIAPEDWERNMNALEDIYALCRRNNIQLVLYRAPTKRLHDADWNRLTAQFDGRDGVSTLNCSDYTAQIAADPESDFYDSLHYNCVGAEKFSAFLADWTKNNLSISPDEPQDTCLLYTSPSCAPHGRCSAAFRCGFVRLRDERRGIPRIAYQYCRARV